MKKAMILAMVLALIWLLSACGGAKLADIYDEDEVTARAKEVVDVINTLDYEAMANVVREDLQDQLTADTLRDAWDPLLSKARDLEEYKSVTVIGQKSQSTGEDYAVAVLACKYENATRAFTISMDQNLDIVGLYMK